ncbi:sugar phosphate isomerase/epimerase family protein [Hufsiella ginkgonis]|uniref:TIM barrel protein n=1 Tax=Hufsiella ginkgonis TaxID=2695274 RepID=A0A7K1Y0I6_9SPHI|nr:sugar phosphate isomerase/epimerase [Hufsiella ginkgonis]MXV16519.1 TIM barrel protein [Hufsiella ginkgonis]
MTLFELSRRDFLAQLSILAASAAIKPSTELLLPAGGPIKFGYSAITWGGNDVQAIKDIASLGFTGIQLRANAYQEYGQKVDELKKMIADAKLELVMFSSGNANVNTPDDQAQIAPHVTHAKFVKALGGKRIQVTNSARPKSGEVAEADLVKYGNMLTVIGKQTAAIGIETTYHNHMGQLGQTPAEVDTILANTDPKYVGFLLDVAHYQQGGGDPAAAILKYKDRIHCLHIKDVKTTNDKGGYQFVELGQGRVDFPAIFDALKKIKFKGYTVVELDGVPVKGRTPLESGQMAKDYLKDKLKFSLS